MYLVAISLRYVRCWLWSVQGGKVSRNHWEMPDRTRNLVKKRKYKRRNHIDDQSMVLTRDLNSKNPGWFGLMVSELSAHQEDRTWPWESSSHHGGQNKGTLHGLAASFCPYVPQSRYGPSVRDSLPPFLNPPGDHPTDTRRGVLY